MPWQIRQDSINDLLSQLNAKIDALVGSKADLEAKLKSFAVAVPVGFCALPGCGRAFLKTRTTHLFHSPECKTIFNNKYRRT